MPPREWDCPMVGRLGVASLRPEIDALDDRQAQTSSSGEQEPEAGSGGLWGPAEDLVFIVEGDGRPATPAEPTELHRSGEAPAVVRLSRVGWETLTYLTKGPMKPACSARSPAIGRVLATQRRASQG